ncbi:MAG: hypothetical protein IJV78_02850 [Clostridia bacterium]|nr:hypothetical protein [Clostridia bacterium]
MSKKIFSIILALILVLSLVSCKPDEPHVCTSACTICWRCTNLECEDPGCADKCPGHAPVHSCESKCATCNKCTDTSCTESVCADKCQGHAPAHTCQNVCDTCGKCTNTNCTETACSDKCQGHVPPHSCQNVCDECGKCTNTACAEAVCANKCQGHERTPVIFLAGDSTVKTYEDGQFIAGWGQFLSYFLGEDVVVKNTSNGGRSSRSFINEGRLFDIAGSSYTFSENGGNSIAYDIQAGDYLFIQFGHNDDDTKMSSSYKTVYDRMTPLGEPDANGIYPTTPGEKMPTTYLPEEFLNNVSDAEKSKAEETLAKYGSTYYAYGSGTFKWYLKQYIDFARSVGAIPVLVTPVARVKFSGSEIIGGAGLHGENFAYVEAVRQLAQEESCLLIDLFADSKQMLETATPTYANFLMALKPNDLTGAWPSAYDTAYGNADAGYTDIEGTHYNKYGAYLQAAAVAQAIIANASDYTFADKVLTTPTNFVDPSNLMSKSTAAAIEALFTTVNVTNPNRTYPLPGPVVELINTLPALEDITNENYVAVGKKCAEIRVAYNALNADDRQAVTNYSALEAAEAKVKELELANRPTPIKVVVFNADALSQDTYDSTVVEGEFTLVATSDKTMEKQAGAVTYTYNGVTYEQECRLKIGGKASFGKNRYVSFTVDGPCTITIVAQSSNAAQVRTVAMVDASTATVGTFEAGGSVTITTVEIDTAGTYSVGSTGSGIYIYSIIIEYFE